MSDSEYSPHRPLAHTLCTTAMSTVLGAGLGAATGIFASYFDPEVVESGVTHVEKGVTTLLHGSEAGSEISLDGQHPLSPRMVAQQDYVLLGAATGGVLGAGLGAVNALQENSHFKEVYPKGVSPFCEQPDSLIDSLNIQKLTTQRPLPAR